MWTITNPHVPADFSHLLKTSLKKNIAFYEVGFLILYYDQVYSNTRVPTQVNTSQHESTRAWHDSKRINTSLTRVNTNQHEWDTSQHGSNTSQHKSDTSQHESTQVKKCPRWVKMSQLTSDTTLTQVNLS